jgi:Bacteriophage head to tail connecting protein
LADTTSNVAALQAMRNNREITSWRNALRIQKSRQHLESRMIGMRVDRNSWWLHWREISDYLLPRRYKWLITPNQMNRGSNINQRIIDSTGTLAWRTCASGMHSGITNPARPWFRFSIAHDPELNDHPEVKEWLDECRNRMMHVFSESNFYNSMHVWYGDLCSFGTAASIEYEDYEDVIRFYNSCLGEYFTANSPRMDVDTLYREFVRTTRQIAKEFGEEVASETVRAAVKTGGALLDSEIIVNHAIEPNDEYAVGAYGMDGMPYREVYWEMGTGHNLILRERGFHEKPIIVGRWDVQANDSYGRSPGMDALGDIKQLQVEQKRKGQGIDKLVNPPMLADPSLKNEPLTTIPGGVTYVATTAAKEGFKPVYQVEPQLDHMLKDIQEVQARVKTVFFYDLFQMISQLDTVRSAAEIAARKEEKLIMLGPVLERVQNEGLDPIIDRTFGIMYRAKLLSPVPAVIRQKRAALKTEYIGILADAQKAVMTAGLERLTQYIGSIAAGQQGQGAIPEILDKLDADEAVDQYAEAMGVSPKIIRPYAKVIKIRAVRAQQQAQQEQSQQAMAAASGAKTMSQTDVGGGINALQLAMGGGK